MVVVAGGYNAAYLSVGFQEIKSGCAGGVAARSQAHGLNPQGLSLREQRSQNLGVRHCNTQKCLRRARGFAAALFPVLQGAR